jgi:hypothetical protein
MGRLLGEPAHRDRDPRGQPGGIAVDLVQSAAAQRGGCDTAALGSLVVIVVLLVLGNSGTRSSAAAIGLVGVS